MVFFVGRLSYFTHQLITMNLYLPMLVNRNSTIQCHYFYLTKNEEKETTALFKFLTSKIIADFSVRTSCFY